MDRLERMLKELHMLVQMYSLERLHLVVCGITTSIPEILRASFVSGHIVILDGSSTLTIFAQYIL